MPLSDKIWWTRKTRIQTEKRLLSNAFQAQLLLIWYSFCSTAAAVYYLQFNPNGEFSSITWVVFSILVLSISGFISGRDFKGRASLVKDSYETLDGLHHRAKSANENVDEIAHEYQQILAVCENHTESDYYKALCDQYLTHNDPKNKESGLSKHPTVYIWAKTFLNVAGRLIFISTLYLLPVIIFLVVESQVVC